MMKEKRITILGSEGQMGKCFCKHFLKEGYEVISYDKNQKGLSKNLDSEKQEKRLKKTNSLKEAVSQAEHVLICAPTKEMPALIHFLSQNMKKDSYVIEISSQKSAVFSSLIEVSHLVQPLSLHPMFGPGVNPRGQNMILVPVKEEKKERCLAQSLFPGTRFVSLDVKEHDRKMALILGLPRLLFLSLASVMIKEKDYSLLEHISGTTFRVQKILTESMMQESRELIKTLISNPELKEKAEEFFEIFKEMVVSIQESKTNKILNHFQDCQKHLSQKTQLHKSYDKFVQWTEVLEQDLDSNMSRL